MLGCCWRQPRDHPRPEMWGRGFVSSGKALGGLGRERSGSWRYSRDFGVLPSAAGSQGSLDSNRSVFKFVCA